VTNNPVKAEELLKRAEEVEDCLLGTVQASTSSGHFQLMGKAEPGTGDSMRETVRASMHGGGGLSSGSVTPSTTLPAAFEAGGHCLR